MSLLLHQGIHILQFSVREESVALCNKNPPKWLLNYCPQVRVSEVLLQSAATEVNVSLQQPPYISKRSSFTCLIILIFVIQQGVFFGQKVSVHYTCIQLTQESTSKCSNLPQNALCRRWLRSGAVLGWLLHLFARQKVVSWLHLFAHMRQCGRHLFGLSLLVDHQEQVRLPMCNVIASAARYTDFGS